MVRVDGSQLTDWGSFHDVFSATFGFPDFYGRNLSAWIDCMTALDEPADDLTTIHGSAADPVVVHVDGANSVPVDILEALTDCAAFVNWSRIEAGEAAILALSYRRTQPHRDFPRTASPNRNG